MFIFSKNPAGAFPDIKMWGKPHEGFFKKHVGTLPTEFSREKRVFLNFDHFFTIMAYIIFIHNYICFAPLCLYLCNYEILSLHTTRKMMWFCKILVRQKTTTGGRLLFIFNRKLTEFVCLIWFFTSQSTIFRLCLGWSSTKQCVLLKDTTQWRRLGSNLATPWSWVKHSRYHVAIVLSQC